jgi:hypothetical protein
MLNTPEADMPRPSKRVMAERWQRRWWLIASWLTAAALTWRLTCPDDRLLDSR